MADAVAAAGADPTKTLANLVPPLAAVEAGLSDGAHAGGAVAAAVPADPQRL